MDTWIQILLITLAIQIFSQFLNKILKMDPKNVKALQARLQALTQEMDAARGGAGGFNAPVNAPTRSYEELNKELATLMKRMMKEQFLPMGIRCGIFWGIWALLGAFYGQYASGVLPFDVLFFGSGWVGAYVMFSFILSLITLGLKKLYDRLKHKPEQTIGSTPELASKGSWKNRLEAIQRDSEFVNEANEESKSE